MSRTAIRTFIILATAAGVCGASAGCESKAGSGALIGGGTGALAGGIIGNQSGHAAGGALIGAGVGAVAGGLIGHGMDKSDEKKQREARDREYREQYQQRSYEDGGSRGYSSGAERVTQEDVIRWTARGTKDHVIIDRIERSGSTFSVTPRDEQRLRDEGVSEDVIRTMKRRSGAARADY